ncbi:MAG: NUDIX hydrolase [Deltaproteobacteria bacterium]|nr:MAG: NUDIX hydrolase [Deltaproteobacteria bacterium]
MKPRHSHCHHCGAAYSEPLGDFPRACIDCGAMVWANPTPVSVLLVPVRHDDRVGLLVIRRGHAPEEGKLALVGGYVEDHETWQQGGAREVLEETGVVVDAADVEPLWFDSTDPKPNRVLLFGATKEVDASTFPAHDEHNAECPARGAIFGPEGLEDVFAFPLHIEAAKRFFASREVTGGHEFTEL